MPERYWSITYPDGTSERSTGYTTVQSWITKVGALQRDTGQPNGKWDSCEGNNEERLEEFKASDGGATNINGGWITQGAFGAIVTALEANKKATEEELKKAHEKFVKADKERETDPEKFKKAQAALDEAKAAKREASKSLDG